MERLDGAPAGADFEARDDSLRPPLPGGPSSEGEVLCSHEVAPVEKGAGSDPSPVPPTVSMGELPPAPDDDEALTFLRAFYPTGQWVLTALNPETGVPFTQTFGPYKPERLRSWLAAHRRDNIYFMVNRPLRDLTKKAKKADVAALHWVHVDIDPRPGRDRGAIEVMLAKPLPGGLPQPTHIIDSGGGFQLFWRLAEPVPVAADGSNITELEAANVAVAQLLGGDDCHNIDRIMRLPGTVNWPNAKKRAAGRTPAAARVVGQSDVSYPLSAFPQHSLPKSAGATGGARGPVALSPADRVTLASVDALDEWGVPNRVKVIVQNGRDPDKPKKGDDSRSAWMFDAVCHMLRSGVPDHIIYSVLLDARFAVSACVLERASPEIEAQRQIEKARAAVEADAPAGGFRRDQFWYDCTNDGFLFLPTQSHWSASAVNAKLGKVGEVTAAGWLRSNRAFQQETWDPARPQFVEGEVVRGGVWHSEPSVTVFNRYLPPPRPAGDASGAARWVEHVRRIYPDDAEHILSWLAHRVQRPGEKVNHALVLGGSPGVGKDSLIVPVLRAVGMWNCQSISPETVMGSFNPFLMSVILIINEVRDLGSENRFAFYERTKTMIAAPPEVHTINEKHRKPYPAANVCGVVMTTNRLDGLHLDADDRRHFVAWSPRVKEEFPPAYWNEYHRWRTEGGGDDDVAAWLAARDLSGWDPKAPPPRTEAFMRVAMNGRPTEVGDIADLLDDMGWPAAVTLRMLADEAGGPSPALAEWLLDRRNSRVAPHRLADAGYEAHPNPGHKEGRWKVGGAPVNIYCRRDLGRAERQEAAEALVRAARVPF